MGSRDGAEEPGVTPFAVEERAFADDCVEIRVGGELDLSTADRLVEALEKALASKAHVILDLEPCSFLDSTGIAAILRARQRMEKLGRVLCAIGASERVDRVLDITGLKATDLVQSSRDAALSVCRRASAPA